MFVKFYIFDHSQKMYVTSKQEKQDNTVYVIINRKISHSRLSQIVISCFNLISKYLLFPLNCLSFHNTQTKTNENINV